ncbi:PTS fructose transporter subunit IIA [Erysipelotrichaceae bacterium]|nr:PTS fructose transporter subunit IIA [Erysipelotrichaceae bacterium]
MMNLLAVENVKFSQGETKEAVILELGATLISQNKITSDYLSEVIQREDQYPTGLDFGHIQIAIPHATTSDSVFETAIAIAKLVKPLSFFSMGNSSEKLEVELVCLLAVKNPQKHLETIQKIIFFFQNKESVQDIKKAETVEELYAIFSKLLQAGSYK